jgi:Icc-related predicted phosphoesterase
MARAPSRRVRIRIAALADLHCPRGRPSDLQKRLHGIEEHADVLLLGGDLTDSGDVHQARALASQLGDVAIPIVAVLGNHDYESGEVDALRDVFGAAGLRLLDGEGVTVGSLGIAGTKGFGGGFGKRRVVGFGEPATKHFVEEGRSEAEKLEVALRNLETPLRVALLHYAPVLGTAIGEAPEIIPFLGNSDLALAAEHGGASAIFHGHCHFGRAEAHSDHGVPVYNCAIPVLDHLRPPRRFALVELELPPAARSRVPLEPAPTIVPPS